LNNPYQTPTSKLATNTRDLEYVGFWARTWASIIDSIISIAVIYPLAFAIYGKAYFIKTDFILGAGDFLLSYVLPAVAVVLFWFYKSATPGKMAIHAIIVDAKTGGKPSTGQFIGRYLSYYLSLLPLGLGFFWVGWDAKKQAWHDKLAGTVVVRPADPGANTVHFTK
jgi:uncharacterized RDD family membrane protein YckC